jgi:hypothetical protein
LNRLRVIYHRSQKGIKGLYIGRAHPRF